MTCEAAATSASIPPSMVAPANAEFRESFANSYGD
jgi:hypothetical protein